MTLEGEQNLNLSSQVVGFHPLNRNKQTCQMFPNNNYEESTGQGPSEVSSCISESGRVTPLESQANINKKACHGSGSTMTGLLWQQNRVSGSDLLQKVLAIWRCEAMSASSLGAISVDPGQPAKRCIKSTVELQTDQTTVSPFAFRLFHVD